MESEWVESTLGALTDWSSGGTPPKDNSIYWGGSIPWISASSMKSGRLSESDRNITEAGLENGSRMAPQGAVLLLVRGSELHKRIPIGIAQRPVAFNQDVKALLPRSGLEGTFLYYWLTGNAPMLLRKVEHTGIGAGKLDTKVMRDLPFHLPPLAEQRAIAHILGTLDDKIELNRRMSETLESMARALFKSWFVDFDPVRAKAAGRDPALPKDLAALFPSRLINSALGEVPEEWEVKVLDDLTGVLRGGDWGLDTPEGENTERARCIRGADIPDLQAGGTGKMPIRHLKPSSLEKRTLADGDLVVEISGGSPTQSTGRPVLVSDLLLRRLDAPLVCSNFCRLLKPKKRVYSRFLYLWLRHLYSTEEFLQFENGTTGIKNLAFTLFSSQYTLCVPSNDVLTVFEKSVSSIFLRHQSLGAETENLAALRDSLLPKLISGELRVAV